MNIRQLQKYAEEHGFDSLEFKWMGTDGKERRGKWLDAYFGCFRTDGMADNEMMMVSTWESYPFTAALDLIPIHETTDRPINPEYD